MRCWPPSSSSPSASVHSLVCRVLGKGGLKLGWESWLKAPGEWRNWGWNLSTVGAEPAGFLGLGGCLLGSEGAPSLPEPVTGPPCWRGSHPAPWVCLRKCREGLERSFETPRGRADFPKSTP